MRLWFLFGALVLAEIAYPLVHGRTRAVLVVATVVAGYLLSVTHAYVTRGARTAAALVVVTTGGGLAIEAAGRTTGFPFGDYDYTGALGPRLLGVPLVVPLAWTWMAWPAWLAAGRLVRRTLPRIGLAGVGLAAWDLFLDPQMVSERYWLWSDPATALPGVPGVPVSNYLGWLVVAIAMTALLRVAAGPDPDGPRADAPMYALYLWTYASSILAHAVFLGLPASAAWGALGMGLVAVPLAVRLWRR
ncbi:carotenoid biosynthesis protein [Dactylosporangium fulvum]|uniref:Carotenoid biosynthesis protein n=1 Tax=Dactylosporangium fulvum TaxID=53359 RepID=A0ABY5VVL1_9ACTN|nr:carotenoid biosynthesis protein [Dactylosporangium fulvum]UWP81094.1 carotenoid biosynthesis protein [Dactylosporangium fulvum]